jgi:hypothetical protein
MLNELAEPSHFHAKKLLRELLPGMVEIENRVNIEIEIYQIEFFLKISKSIFIKSK